MLYTQDYLYTNGWRALYLERECLIGYGPTVVPLSTRAISGFIGVCVEFNLCSIIYKLISSSCYLGCHRLQFMGPLVLSIWRGAVMHNFGVLTCCVYSLSFLCNARRHDMHQQAQTLGQALSFWREQATFGPRHLMPLSHSVAGQKQATLN